MSAPRPETVEQIIETYRRMVTEARVAPAAPSDGLGNVVGRRNTAAESKRYVNDWWEEEQGGMYAFGCPSWEARPALIFTAEAGRMLCGVKYKAAARLLRMAADELDGLRGMA